MFEKYGPVVRIAPNELAYASADAWREILGHNPKGEEAGKYTPFYKVSEAMPSNVINENRERHAVLRRNLAHGFSDRSMRAQEPLIKGYIDMMINGLRERSAQGMKALDMAMWFNFATFDVSSPPCHDSTRLAVRRHGEKKAHQMPLGVSVLDHW